MQYNHLTLEERCRIEVLLQDGISYSEIARDLKRKSSTVSREVRRNMGRDGYQYEEADGLARRRRTEASSVPRKMTSELRAKVESLIRRGWSPEQAAGRLRLEGVVSVSAKWIYRYVWADRKAGGTLYRHLRRRGKKPNRRGKNEAGRGLIPGRVDISQRPKEVEDKTRVGDWEADTIVGARHRGALVSLVDRNSKFTYLAGVKRKTSAEVKDAMVGLLGPVRDLVRTITADNGKEFAGHAAVSEALGAGFYFAAPYHSWERGLNEHTNGLVREYFPKKKDLLKVKPRDVKRVEDALNTRPRKALGYKTPAEVFSEALEAIGASCAEISSLCRADLCKQTE